MIKRINVMGRKINKLTLPERLSFFEEIYLLLKEVLLNALEALISFLDDVRSFRNCLVVLTFGLVVWIIQTKGDTTVTLTALGLWSTILAWYFKLRQDSKNDK